jgi:hypothetical protein
VLIGYEGYSSGNAGIADRRRILYWAAARGHTIIDSRDSRAEIIVITSSSNLGYWAKAKISTPIILDVVDGLVGEQSLVRNLLRGYGYWGTRRSTTILPNTYRQLILAVARKCKIVVCSSPEQVTEWAKYKVNAVDILDIHEEIPHLNKSAITTKDISNEIFWEGLPATLDSMSLLNDFFTHNQNSEFTLNVLTNLNSYKYMNKYIKIDLIQMLKKQLNYKNLNLNLIPWSANALTTYSQKSTLGVIPILGFKGYNHLKAENRLLIMWRLGLPVLTSPLASYRRVMIDAGIDGICENQEEWRKKLNGLFESAGMREEFIGKSRLYLIKRHNLDDILKKWDFVLEN